ncbi:MAG: selenocysteine-specific translation elongation factor, partial [Proteobacteria bacterium]|nr:selenocysteine-specific translation elongation factor [Pseudomonadota bacterium]
MLIGTAGHIDHGKTTLVRALTGVDTDRLPEEKRRGITIELGYAYLPCGADDPAPEQVIGFVDVPGHEKFVPTMLAGASGVDFALLVVAADDGPMPQTREHLQILELLGLGRGAVALTKADRAGPEQIARVSHAIAALLAPTRLAGAPIFPVSAITGDGVGALREHLLDAARSLPLPSAEGGFRLAVDRVFSLPGAGTIVAGTVHAGQVAVGDTIRVTPSGTSARVRSLHVQNRKADVGRAGQRCALNLAGLSVDQVKRGDWLCDPAQALPNLREDNNVTIAELLGANGYRTYLAGKWHLGGGVRAPEARGFQQVWRFASATAHSADTWNTNAYTLVSPDGAITNRMYAAGTFYQTDAIGDYSLDFLNHHAAQGDQKPFLLYMAFGAPHFPIQAP